MTSCAKAVEERREQQAALLRQLLAEKFEPIAIVGSAFRLPGGADDLDELGQFLHDGGSGIGPIPPDRWDAEAYAGEERGQIRQRRSGFIAGFDQFDPGFFNISPREAHFLDPQQRLVLQTSWHALEDANLDPSTLAAEQGAVYMAASSLDYLFELESVAERDLDGRIAAGVSHAAISGRLSYFLGWRGPNLTLDTACSSSLVALHLAVQGLRRRECSIALCGGVNLIHHPRSSVLFSDLNALCEDGYCKSFDDRADGYGRGEGCAVLVLKRLSDATAAGDRILGVVRGTAIGQDGASAGLTAPNGIAQQALMRQALTAANLKPADINYLEAHGTGTPLGDPIEVAAIAEVFGSSHSADRPLPVGTIKANIGHLEPAAGMAGILRVLAQFRRRQIFGHPNLQTPSRRIPWSRYPVDVPTEPAPWTDDTRRAIVNSFGFTGSIASAVLEQPPAPVAVSAVPSRPEILTVSARSEAALAELLARHLDQAPTDESERRDWCRTSNLGRMPLSHRAAVVVGPDGTTSAPITLPRRGRQPKTAWLFTGQGSQRAGMGREPAARYPVFAETLAECDRLFAEPLGLSIRDLMFGADGADLDDTRYTQCAMFSYEYSIAQLWLSWGVTPRALLGHSLGELVAATVAGVFSLPDAVRVVAERGRLMSSTTVAGGMISVRATAAVVTPILEETSALGLAALNSPSQTVVSGAAPELLALGERLTEAGLAWRRLPVSQGFHSPLMAPAASEFATVLDEIALSEPRYSIISNSTGRLATIAELTDPKYWAAQLTEPVDFLAAMRTLAERGTEVYLEVGPDRTLIDLGRRCVGANQALWLDSSADGLATALAGLWVAGTDIAWSAVHEGRPGPGADLPKYPFQTERYWLRTSGRSNTAPIRATPVPVEAPRPAGTADAKLSPTLTVVRRELATALEYGSAGEVDVDRSFLELGLDSLSAQALAVSLGQALDRELELAAVMQCESARELADELDRTSQPVEVSA